MSPPVLRGRRVEIRLDNLQRLGCWELARARQAAKGSAAADTSHPGTEARSYREWEEGHYIGIKGEYSLARFLQLQDGLDLEARAGPDPGYDLIWRGHRVDVKNLYGPTLIVEPRALSQADLVVLAGPHDTDNTWWPAVPDPRITADRYQAHRWAHVVLRGWVWTAEYTSRAHPLEINGRTVQAVAEERLREPYDLFHIQIAERAADPAPWDLDGPGRAAQPGLFSGA